MRHLISGLLVPSLICGFSIAGFAAESAPAGDPTLTQGEGTCQVSSPAPESPHADVDYVLCKDVKMVKKALNLFQKSAKTYEKAGMAMCEDRVRQFGRHHMSSCGMQMSIINKVKRFNIELSQLWASLKHNCTKRKPKNQGKREGVQEQDLTMSPMDADVENRSGFKPKCRDVKKWHKAGKHWDAGNKKLCAASAAICKTAPGSRSCSDLQEACEEDRPERKGFEKQDLAECR